MTHDYNNGQIWGWNGGECPVHPKTVVIIWTDEGYYEGRAGHCRWGKDTTGWDPDIVAFKVVKQYAEPKVIWVNEYPEELVAYPDEQSARAGASIRQPPLRIAVKYVEAVNEKDAPHD